MEDKQASSSRSVERAMSILECFLDKQEYILLEIAEKTQLSPSTVLRILTALQEHDFVVKNVKSKTYHLGSKISWLAEMIPGKSFEELRSLAYPYMLRINQKYNEDVHLFVHDGKSKLCIEAIDSRRELRQVIRVGSREYEIPRSNRLISGEEEPVLKPSGEEGHLLIKALLGLGDLVSNVNMPNRGQVPDLPFGAVVETNAFFSRARIDPLFAGETPRAILPLITRHVLNQENTLAAALNCDRKLGFITFMNDPQLSSVPPEAGEKLFSDMLENQRAWLPEGWFR